MSTECIKNVLGFSRKKVIEICNYILWWLGDWLYEYINVTQESVSCLDFKIFGRNNASVCCHSTILMLALPLMRHLLCDESCLILPDFSLEELKSFVKLLYGGGNRFIYWLNIGAKWKNNENELILICVSIKGSATSMKKIGAVLAALGQPNTAVAEVDGKSYFNHFTVSFRTALPVMLSPCHQPHQRYASNNNS